MAQGSVLPVPPSFMAIYLPDGGRRLYAKPKIPHQAVADRHEFCDDLAQMLMEPARNTQFDLGLDEATVIEHMARTLMKAEQAVVSPAEANWVACRLAELLNWPLPLPGGPVDISNLSKSPTPASPD